MTRATVGHAGSGRHLLSEEAKVASVHYSLMGFVPGQLMFDAKLTEVFLNDTVVHRSRPDSWITQVVNCAHT